MKHLSEAIGMLRAGSKINDVARNLGCSRQTNNNLRNRFNTTDDVKDSPRPGRARATTLRTDCITLMHIRNHFPPATVSVRRFRVHALTTINRPRQTVLKFAYAAHIQDKC